MDNPGKWWGWGKIDQFFSLEERPGFWPYLQQELELPEVWQGLPPVPLSQIEWPPVRIPPGVRDAMVRVVGETGVTSEKLERVVHTLGKSYRDLVRSRHGPITAETLAHFPQSFEHSTLGGWIVTRSAGQLSNRLGKIEDMVLGLKLVTPSGVLKVRTLPASATGPDLRGMGVGSEGTLGVIVEATVRLQPLPKHRDYRGILFTDFRAGTEALRRIFQGNFPPAVMRPSDEKETVAGIQLSHPPASWLEWLKRRVGRWFLERKGYGAPPQGCLLILGIEGDRKQVELERREALRICKEMGGTHLGRGPGQRGKADPSLADGPRGCRSSHQADRPAPTMKTVFELNFLDKRNLGGGFGRGFHLAFLAYKGYNQFKANSPPEGIIEVNGRGR